MSSQCPPRGTKDGQRVRYHRLTGEEKIVPPRVIRKEGEPIPAARCWLISPSQDHGVYTRFQSHVVQRSLLCTPPHPPPFFDLRRVTRCSLQTHKHFFKPPRLPPLGAHRYHRDRNAIWTKGTRATKPRGRTASCATCVKGWIRSSAKR